ncbi:PQQ-binding-like beta-propeller repeat protein [Streptomyces sp. NPDC005406]|uniref:outer membrane protein assembly factor BamB family protein n=1 Tax=Streptomyces sp. NPDC005406 TaxID=3155339 RepID=UPI003453AC0D
MPRTPQPWDLPPPEQRPVPGNPYATEGYGAPLPPSRRRRFGRGPTVATAVVLPLLLACAGVYAVTVGRSDGSAAPEAEATPRPSGTPTAPRTPAVRTPEQKEIPTSEQINAGRKPGDAKAWVVDDRTDLPRRNIKVHDLWTVGDTVVQAAYRKVSAYRLSDGAEVWSVPLPAPVCETPVNPTPDGKVVLVYKSSQARRGARCNQLRMIDLRTGKTGWQKELVETGSADDTFSVNSAISGGVLAIGQSMRAAAYRVEDGVKLYDIPMENPGKCYPDDVAGGTRLLVASTCAISFDGSKSYNQLREIDPRTGKVLWRFRTPPGWQVGKVLSVAPVVFTTLHNEERTDNWRIVALGPGGALRTTVDPRSKGFTHCADAGESGENIQNCKGTLVGRNTVFLGGTNQAGAYDLGTGKLAWGVKSEDSTLNPLQAESGSSALVYEAATPSRPGRIIRFGPGGVDTDKQVLQHPESAAATEYGMLAGHLAYANGRIVITPAEVSGDDSNRQARMLSFAPQGPRAGEPVSPTRS